MFILVSTPGSALAAHGHKLLLVSPIIEGLLGGWTTLQSGTSAYISDCTSSGSRAQIFSRFTGVFYLGFSVGPGIGGWLIRNAIWSPSAGGVKSVTSVFWVAVCCSFLNFVLVLFVFPESLDQERRQRAAIEYQRHSDRKGKAKANVVEIDQDSGEEIPRAVGDVPEEQHKGGIIREFLSPLAIFMPVVVVEGSRKRRDWTLTLLAGALFGYMLSGVSHYSFSHY